VSFAAPHLLWLLLVPALWLAWGLSRRARAPEAAHPKIFRAEAGARTLEISNLRSQISNGAAASPSASTRPSSRWRLHLGLALAILALARPQWGRLEEPVFAQSRDIILALDLSRSMLAEDVKPTRLARAKLLVQSLLEKLRGERVGLIVFSGTAFLQAPLSADYEILREFLPALGPEHLPEGGTDYDALLDTATRAFGGSDADRFLIILSDGEANDDSWKARLDALKAKNIRVLGLALGTTEGAIIPDGAGGFVKDTRGAVVLSKREEATLRELSEATNGAYTDASGWVDLAQLLNTTVAQGRRGEFREAGRMRLAERFQWALAPALLLLAWSFWREFPVRPRPRTLALRVEQGKGNQNTGNVAAITTALLLILSAFSLLPAPAQAVERTDLTPADKLGRTIAKLAAQDARGALDWAALADATLAWGEPIKSENKPVADGPVRDALAATDLGEKLDRRAADWPALRGRLEKLLEKPDESKPDNPPPQPDSAQNQKPSEQSKGSGSPQNQPPDQKPNQPQNQSDLSQPSDNQADSSSQPQDSQPPPDQKNPAQSSQPPEQNANGNPTDKNAPDIPKDQAPPSPSAQQSLGDLKSPPPPPPNKPGDQPPGEMQQVGGVPAGATTATISDPALAAELQKLDQVRAKDSPVLLFQLMQQQDGAKSPVRKDRNW
jgi:Ca-activated chloride channel family protein